MFAIVYNLIRLAMLEAAQRRQIDPDRVSFVDALRWLRCAGQGGSLRPIRVVPERLGRHDPRVKKRRAKNYRLMTKPRSDLMQLLAAQSYDRKLCPVEGKEKGGVSCCDLFTNSSPRRAERIRHHARFYGSRFDLSIRSQARQEAGSAGGDRDVSGRVPGAGGCRREP